MQKINTKYNLANAMAKSIIKKKKFIYMVSLLVCYKKRVQQGIVKVERFFERSE